MKVLGFDASTSTVGYGVIDITNSKITLVHSGYFKPSKKGTIFERLVGLKIFVKELLSEFKPDEVAIEDIVQFMKKKSGAKTIIPLAVFNRTVGLTIYEELNKNPILLNVNTIRSIIKPKSVKGRLLKEDVPDVLKNYYEFDLPVIYKKNKKIADETFDISDGVAVALACSLKMSR